MRDETADVSMVQRGSMPRLRYGLGDGTGARSSPLPKIAVLPPHILQLAPTARFTRLPLI